MESNNYGGEENLSFRQIVLNYMRKIMYLNLKVVPQGAIIDYTKCYKRAVLGLSDVLLPFFDDEMTSAYNRFLEEYDFMMRETTDGQKILNQVKYCSDSMRICRDLFRKLNLLLNRNDYLKSNVYGEDKDELAQEESEGEDD